jgi:preprotein translocase subunit SecE
MLQRQGQVDQEGSPVAGTRQPPRTAPSRRGVGGVGAGGGRDVPTSGGTPRGPRGGPVQFVREVRGELRRVAWGTREEVQRYTLIVITVLIILVSYVFLLNLGFSKAISALFGT